MLSEVGVDTAVTSLSVGAVVSITKVLTDKLPTLLALSVTLTAQLLYVPSASSLKVMEIFSSATAVVVALLLQLPPYVIVPASFVLKV